MLIIGALAILVLSIFVAAIFVYERLESKSEKKQAQVESDKQLIIAALRDVNTKLKAQVAEASVLNNLLYEKSQLEQRLTHLTATAEQRKSKSP